MQIKRHLYTLSTKKTKERNKQKHMLEASIIIKSVILLFLHEPDNNYIIKMYKNKNTNVRLQLHR